MTETNELQPTPEVEAAEVQATQAPVTEQDETQAVEQQATEPSEEARPTYETKEQVVERLREIQAENNGGDRSELDLLKQAFYKLHKAAQIAARNAFISATFCSPKRIPERLPFASALSLIVTVTVR